MSPVPVAQLDKASDYESEDWGFKSLTSVYLRRQVGTAPWTMKGVTKFTLVQGLFQVVSATVRFRN